MGIENLQLAGLTDEEGRLGRRVPSGKILVPGFIYLSEAQDEIVWTWSDRNKTVTPSPTMLNEFVGLSQKPPTAVLKFAQKWGVLSLDENGKACEFIAAERSVAEPIALWMLLSRQVRAILNIAADLRENRLSAAKHWSELHLMRALIGGDGTPELCAQLRTHNGVETVESHWKGLERVLNAWLVTGVGFGIRTDGSGLRLEVKYGGSGYFLTALAFQMVLSIIGSGGLFFCSACGRPYARQTKAPGPGQANYCPDCKEGKAPARHSQKRRREKIASAVKLDAAGVSVDEIASQLNTSPKSVQGWLQARKG